MCRLVQGQPLEEQAGNDIVINSFNSCDISVKDRCMAQKTTHPSNQQPVQM